MNTRSKLLTLLMILPFLVSGCSSDPVTPTETPSSAPEATVTSTLVLQNTTAPTFTPVIPTSSSIPTLEGTAKVDVFTDLFMDNNGCEFPCWWGIEPEVTPVEELSSLSVQIGETPRVSDENGYREYFYSMSLDDFNFVDISIDFFTMEDRVQYITLQIDEPSRFHEYQQALSNLSLEAIFSQYGKPTEIYLGIGLPIERDSDVVYTLFIQYLNYGFTIAYPGTTRPEENLSICTGSLEDVRLEAILMFLGSQNQGPEMFTTNAPQPNQVIKKIGEVGGTSIDQLYTEVIEENKPFCIYTPASEWK